MLKIFTLFLAPVFIFLANVVLVWPLFAGGYTQQMGSIESVFIADARFIAENFPHLSWNPYWYAGFPFHLFYTPLLPFLMALLHALAPAISLASWYRILIGLFYAATPVSFYFLAKFLTGRSLVGFLASLFYSFLPSIGYWLPQVGGMAQSFGNAPWRLLTLILFGEGGHIVGLFFLPLALLFFIKAIRKVSWGNVFLASLFGGLLALTNIIALIGFGVMLVVVLLVEVLESDWSRKLLRGGVVLLFTFGLAAFWFNLSFVRASLSIGTGGVEGGVGDAYLRSLPVIFLLAPALFFLAMVAKKKVFRPILMAVGWVIIFFAAAYFWFKGRTMLLPQPNRYLPEMDMGTALLFSWGAILLVEKILSQKLAWGRKVFYVLIILLILYLPLRYIKQVWELTRPHKDITQTSEYRIASWFKDNTQGERIYASGSSAFWLNTFSASWRIPQIRGGNDGVANPWILHAVYQINTGENAPKNREGETAADWLRALNVSYLVVNLPTSTEIFHDFRNPERFTQASGFEEQANFKGDVIYRVPLQKSSLAQVVSKNDLSRLRVLKNGADLENLEKYTDYIDNQTTSGAQFSWVGVGQAKIKADLKDNEGVGIQVTASPGWKAFVDNKQIPVKNDVIGFIFLDPKKVGPVEIDLVYGRTWDVWLGYFLTVLAFGGLVAYPALSARAAQLFKKAPEKVKEEEEDE